MLLHERITHALDVRIHPLRYADLNEGAEDGRAQLSSEGDLGRDLHVVGLKRREDRRARANSRLRMKNQGMRK